MVNINKFTEVTENFYKDFLRWGRDNIEGFHYEVIMIADRTVIKNKEEEVLAYRNLAYVKTYHIRRDVIDRLINKEEASAKAELIKALEREIEISNKILNDKFGEEFMNKFHTLMDEAMSELVIEQFDNFASISQLKE